MDDKVQLQQSKSIAIIGGGAAGFFAAITAAERNPTCKVTIFEASKTTLGKVRISGGGRCNVTHSCFDPGKLVENYPRGSRELISVFNRFQPQDTCHWFETRGVKLKTETDRRIFPVSDDSQTIVDCLETAARQAGVRLLTGVRVESLTKSASQFEILDTKKQAFNFDAVVIATGSANAGYEFARKFGHTIIKPVPSIFTFTINDRLIENLAGISVPKAELELIVDNLDKPAKPHRFAATGPTLITHWGLSGPAVLRLSAWAARELAEANYQARLGINFLPSESVEQAKVKLQQLRKTNPKLQVSHVRIFPFPARLWESMLHVARVDSRTECFSLSNTEINNLVQVIFATNLCIGGKGVFKEEFVTAGGVKLSEVKMQTMESKICSGLYFVGEVLDIDGITGGFNFQNAWSTGYLAGMALG
ncbi:NAD(P)/FAD-dependent oxidoreductase [bacterium]|nr:NAD(P)/FAD-dependent oxidoreductase [bacterium]